MLKIRKSVRRPNELKEIFKEENPELRNKVQVQSKRLFDLQEKIIPVMPLRQQQLPKDAGLLKEVEGQFALQSYTLARSLYIFAGKANLQIDEQCASYAKALNDNRS